MCSDSVHYVDLAISSRQSIRAFLPKPVAPQLIKDIFNGCSTRTVSANTQPGKSMWLQATNAQK